MGCVWPTPGKMLPCMGSCATLLYGGRGWTQGQKEELTGGGFWMPKETDVCEYDIDLPASLPSLSGPIGRTF